MIDIHSIPCVELDADTAKDVNIAVDIADNILIQSLDFAQNFSDSATTGKVNRFALAMAHSQIAIKAYAARLNKRHSEGGVQ